MAKTATGASNLQQNQIKRKVVPDAIVIFRPTDKFKGEFGFDWIRLDTKLKTENGEQDYFTPGIMGYYVKGGNSATCKFGRNSCSIINHPVCTTALKCFDCLGPKCEPCLDTNAWSGTLRHDNNPNDIEQLGGQTKALRGSFLTYSNSFLKDNTILNTIHGKAIKRKWFTYTPKMTLLPKKTAYLNYFVYIKNESLEKGLVWKYKKEFFNVNIKKKENKGTLDAWQKLLVEIKCKKEFSQKEYIEVYIDDDSKPEKLCGQLEILPNNKGVQEKKELLIIKVKTKLSKKTKTGKFKKEELKIFENVGRQAYINFVSSEKKISFVDNSDFTQKYVNITNSQIVDFDEPTTKPGCNKYILQYLVEECNKKYPKHINSTKVFLIDEETDDGTLGYSLDKATNACVIFKTEDASTVIHEILHVYGLAHTFTAQQVAAGIALRVDYTHKALQTDNIMDYSHWYKIEKINLFQWQWKAINPKISL